MKKSSFLLIRASTFIAHAAKIWESNTNSGLDQNLKYFIVDKLQSISDRLTSGKIVPPVTVGSNQGDRFQVLAVSNSERIIKLRGSQTDGRLMIMEGEILVGEGHPHHIHHREDEYFHVLVGKIEFYIGEETIRGTTGTWIFASRYIKHSYRNVNST
ncbi:unnamed protein product [Rotaria magnacalcarata]|uniref:Cupin type-2 domain-containing protein n=1 Tax=Rotaria magnacalcarata TaxID=392030 RepID=A0A816VEJ0_9BILA|nr:unnamed protein product [Rotaria magnacalcarata]CAF2124680.1 unnamed protein product [Rotaria magnacalcarata]CAF3813126.1 unnamed protein product [Rotaria magnacalcarata]CAF3957023.1 unnamed protein product [Rotaria magnacalcarata]